MLKKLDHVGIVVKDLDKALEQLGDMLQLTTADIEIIEVKDIGVKIALLPIEGALIELLEPIGTQNRFARHLQEKGEGLFHLSMFATNYDKEISVFREKGYHLEEECTAQLFKGHTVRLAWLSPEQTTGAWIEIVDIDTLPPEVSGSGEKS